MSSRKPPVADVTILRSDKRSITIRVPYRLTQVKGRKAILTPSSVAVVSHRPPDSTLIKALARAHRWRDRMESGDYTTVRELAKAEKINESYLCRMLRLTLLSPKITEAILNGSARPNLATIQKPFPSLWENQDVS